MSIDEWWYCEGIESKWANTHTHTHYTTCTCIIPLCLCRLYTSHGVYIQICFGTLFIVAPHVWCHCRKSGVIIYTWPIPKTLAKYNYLASADKLEKKPTTDSQHSNVSNHPRRNPEQNTRAYMITASSQQQLHILFNNNNNTTTWIKRKT